jgi:hypothetical protein
MCVGGCCECLPANVLLLLLEGLSNNFKVSHFGLLPIVSVQLTNFTKASFLSSYLGGTKSVHKKKGNKNHMLYKFSSSLQKRNQACKKGAPNLHRNGLALKTTLGEGERI